MMNAASYALTADSRNFGRFSGLTSPSEIKFGTSTALAITTQQCSDAGLTSLC
jgi:hypothetical protein